jgi:hypothetical protein
LLLKSNGFQIHLFWRPEQKALYDYWEKTDYHVIVTRRLHK